VRARFKPIGVRSRTPAAGADRPPVPGPGVYFDDPNGHLMEVLTKPYGASPEN
jgi:hypothetical protein